MGRSPPHIPAARLGKKALFPRQVQPLLGKDASLSQANTSHLNPPPSLPTSPVEDANLSQAITPLPSQPNTLPTPSHTSSQAGEDSTLPQAGATPPGEDVSLSQGQYTPYPLPSQPTALLPSPEDRGAPNLPNTQAGQSNNLTNYPRQGSRHPPRQSPPPGLPGGSNYLPGRQQLHQPPR